MKNRLNKISNYLLLSAALCQAVGSSASQADDFTSDEARLLAMTGNNDLFLQGIIALLIVVIFSYVARLFYEKKINKE